jgi:hypothetical protein
VSDNTLVNTASTGSSVVFYNGTMSQLLLFAEH